MSGSEPDRRAFLKCLGAGGAAAALPGVARSGCSDPHGAAPGSAGPGLAEIAERLRRAPRAEALGVAVGLGRDGCSYRDLLGGVFLAGVHDISPRPVGFKFHAVMMVGSAFQIAEAVGAGDRMLPVLFNVEDLKRSQARDAQDGDWALLPLAPGMAAVAGATAAASALRDALDGWRDDDADRAVAALFESTGLDELFEVLWPYGARDFGNIGHKMIYTAQAYRCLQQIGWRFGQPVLRSVVRALLDGKQGDNDAPFEPNRRAAARLGDGWLSGEGDPAASRKLLIELRDADPAQAAALAAAALERGDGPAAVWDGLRLWAFEQLMRMPGILAVHPVTTVNAFHIGFRTSRDNRTRGLMVLQAASWLALFQRFLAGRGMRMDGPGIDTLAPDHVARAGEASAGPPPPAREILAEAARDRARAAVLACRLVAADGVDAIAGEVRQQLTRKVREHHDYKFAAAVLEEGSRAHPDIAPQLIGAALYYLRNAGDEDGPFYRSAAPLLGR